jgi:hypothetical protein
MRALRLLSVSISFFILCADDRNETPIDRLEQAGDEFKKGRTWPTAQHGVQHVWDIVSCIYQTGDRTSSP